MTKEEIDNVICWILRNDGPDGHIDGHDTITSFILALLEGRGRQWEKAYEND